ncbi:DUF4880 domain-containing protein [Sphingomonas sp. AP4-R1]|uniref:FecR family protein n=1 Tax=Sphingomonas sp. AP4-R1 TaxID=2735134 RepID=UPI001493A820|nr:FecR domain-containing protein [Sphingomonas sp. AP4-R1]QJU59840.1 DUF4880 domain-containing protein [Sphingomonas sp. AP4-R1]
MTGATNTSAAIAVDTAAAEWVVRLSGEISADERQAFEQWRAADARHAGSFLRASALALAAQQLDSASQAIPGEVASALVATRPTRRQLLAGGGTIAAVAAGLVALALRPESVSSDLGETRSLPLRDGSTALLNTASTVRIAYSKEVRRIDLVHGEAWFDVAHDTARPFIVRAGRLHVRAVGTAFAVRQLDNGGVVTVTEGVVLAWLDGHEQEAIRIAAGSRGVVTDRALRHETRPVGEDDRQLAWRTGMIVLDGQTLREAADDFNRYNPVKLVIDDPALAGQRIYGTFRARDPEALGHAVSVSLNTSVRHDADRIIIGK